MEFCIQLSADYPDDFYAGDRIYSDMLVQALLADTQSYDSVWIVEHHLIICLLMPAPLRFAFQIASLTDRLKILTPIFVLPIHCMRTYAGKIVVQIFSRKAEYSVEQSEDPSDMKLKDWVCHWKRRKLVSISPLKYFKLN